MQCPYMVMLAFQYGKFPSTTPDAALCSCSKFGAQEIKLDFLAFSFELLYFADLFGLFGYLLDLFLLVSPVT